MPELTVYHLLFKNDTRLQQIGLQLRRIGLSSYTDCWLSNTTYLLTMKNKLKINSFFAASITTRPSPLPMS